MYTAPDPPEGNWPAYAARSGIENIQLDTEGIRSGAEGT